MFDDGGKDEDRFIIDVILFVCQKVMSICSTLPSKLGQIQGIQMHHKDHFTYKEANGGIGVHWGAFWHNPRVGGMLTGHH